MLDRVNAIRSLGVKAVFAVVIGSSMLVAACGSPAATGTTNANPSLTACSVSASDLVTGSGGNGTAPKVAGVSGKIAVDGSSALAPLFQAAGQEFDNANPTQTTVTPNGSGNGLKDVQAGAVNIGLSDVFAQTKEPTPGAYSDLVDHQVAAVVFTLVTSNDLKGKVDNLTTDQIKQIYTGQITNWSQIGGPNEAITVINRPLASGTRATFKQYVLGGVTESAGTTLTQDTTGAVAAAVKATPGSIGYVSIGFVTGQYANDVAPICINGAKADATDVNSGKYNFWGIEHAYTKGPATGNAKALLQYVESDQVQKNDLLRLSYLPVSEIAASAIAAHTPSGAPAPEQLPALGS
jgi:phosphate transport system substrate-binding protein